VYLLGFDVWLCVLKRLAVAAAFLFLFVPALRAQTANDLALVGVSNMTKTSTGIALSGSVAGWRFDQDSGDGFGESVEYEHWWAKNGLFFAYSRTATDSTLIVANTKHVDWKPGPQGAYISPDGLDWKWSVARNEFNVLYARRFLSKGRISPRVMGGFTSILLDGGQASGLDRQFAAVVGVGNDFRLTSRFSFRTEFMANFLKASDYGDPTWAASRTVMIETRAGLVWHIGTPRPKNY
jgi:hypothetical protein